MVECVGDCVESVKVMVWVTVRMSVKVIVWVIVWMDVK